MPNTTNIGILAHVDAGKTSLTERILFHAGVIPAIGDVDHGTAQTDTMEMERQRGISIQSAVTSFHIGEQKFNLIDTPGHSDFIAEVERALHVLDGVILVISAVEGIQPQTRRLSRVIRQMGLPCMVVVNKIDRAGARADGLLDDIPAQLGVHTLPLNTPHALGTRKAQTEYIAWRDAGDLERAVDVLSRHDPVLLDAYVEHDGKLDERHIRVSLQSVVRSGAVWPAIYASAITRAGMGDLFAAMRAFMPLVDADPDAPARAEVFKIVRTPAGERLVMADAIRAAGTVVCEPVHNVTVYVPLEAVGAVIHALTVHRGTIDDISLDEDGAVVMSTVPAAEIDALSHELPGLTNGRADLDTRFKDFMPVAGDPPMRARTDLNPFDRTEFMSRLSGRF